MLGIILPSRYEGTIQISFVGKWYWRVAEILSVLSVLWIFGMWFFDKRKNSKSISCHTEQVIDE